MELGWSQLSCQKKKNEKGSFLSKVKFVILDSDKWSKKVNDKVLFNYIEFGKERNNFENKKSKNKRENMNIFFFQKKNSGGKEWSKKNEKKRSV